MKRSWLARHPIGFMALYTIFYLSVFHSLEANVPLRSILVHCRLDDLIPFLSLIHISEPTRPY